MCVPSLSKQTKRFLDRKNGPKATNLYLATLRRRLVLYQAVAFRAVNPLDSCCGCVRRAGLLLPGKEGNFLRRQLLEQLLAPDVGHELDLRPYKESW